MAKSSGTNEKFNEVNTPDFLQVLLQGPGKNRAFRKLVEATHFPLMFYIKKFVSSQEEAQEVLQEVYVGVFQGLASFQGKSKLTTWMFGIAHHKVFDKLSDRSWQMEEFQEYKTPNPVIFKKTEGMAESSEWDASPENLHDTKTVKTEIPRAAEKLPKGLQAVYHLRDMEGLSGSEVADIMQISEQAVRVRLHRARQQIVESVKSSIKSKSQGVISAGREVNA